MKFAFIIMGELFNMQQDKASIHGDAARIIRFRIWKKHVKPL